MANPFVAGADGDPTAGLPTPDTFDQLREQWNTFLDKPEGRAALLSFGINLMQPPHFGDNPLAQIGRAVGAAGETGANIEKMDIAQQEAQSREEARAAAANLAGARAGQVGLASQLGQERAANALTLGKLAASNQLYARYNAFRHDRELENEKRAADIVTPRPPIPVPSFEEWLAIDPGAADIAIRAGIGVTPKAPATPAAALSPLDQQALDWANANPNDPKAAEIHKKLGR